MSKKSHQSSTGLIHKPMSRGHDDSKMRPSHDSTHMDDCYKSGGAVSHPGHHFGEQRRAVKKNRGGSCGP